MCFTLRSYNTFFVRVINAQLSYFRCVPYNQRAYALGFQFIFQRCLGFLPGPILFGAIFDGTCLLWGKSCGKQGNCQFFEMNRLTDRLGYTGLSFTGQFYKALFQKGFLISLFFIFSSSFFPLVSVLRVKRNRCTNKCLKGGHISQTDINYWLVIDESHLFVCN